MTITNRRKMLDEVANILVEKGWWGDRVRVRESADAFPEEFATPFAIVHPITTDLEPKSSAQTFMTMMVGITVVADLTEPEWTIKGYGDGTPIGLLELQDEIFEAFKRGSLGDLVHFTFITGHAEATPVSYIAGDSEYSVLRSTSQLMLKNYQYG